MEVDSNRNRDMDRFLFHTAVPILLDRSRDAGRMARELYCRYGISSHSFCPRRNLLLRIYAQCHHTLPYAEGNDGVTLRLLLAFAKEWRGRGGILLLIPCSPEATAFLERTRPQLEEDFIIADPARLPDDPLGSLLRREGSRKE